MRLPDAMTGTPRNIRTVVFHIVGTTHYVQSRVLNIHAPNEESKRLHATPYHMERRA